MSFNPNLTSTPPRPFRIVLGAVLAIGGLLAGITRSVHVFHTASIMQGDAIEMDWETLANEGFGDQPHIRLVNVHVVDPFIELGGSLDGDEPDRWIDDLADDPLAALLRNVELSQLGPAKVVPVGSDAGQVPPRIVVAGGTHSLDEAFRQIDEDGSIVGVVSTYGVDQMINDSIAYLIGKAPSSTVPEGDVCYTIEPIAKSPDVNDASQMFLLTGFALSLGLVLCGSGGPGFWCCWYAPLPSLISLIGFPMRYGRGSWTTRAVYGGGGLLLMGWGYYLLTIKGQFAAANGNPIFHAMGFAILFSGLAGVLAVPMQITFRALSTSVECKPKPKPVRMSWEQTCSMEPVVCEVKYEDQPLVRSTSLPLVGELKQKAEALEAVGFGKAESMQWQRESGLAAAAVQLGCRNMVVSDLEYNNESDIIESGLISILGTGLPVITLSANSGVQKNRPSSNLLLQRASNSNPADMLGEHLETVVGEAERKDTIVVEIDESERVEIVQLARRSLAEIQGMIDGQMVSVAAQRYGRFHYPPSPVAERQTPVSVSSQ